MIDNLFCLGNFQFIERDSDVMFDVNEDNYDEYDLENTKLQRLPKVKEKWRGNVKQGRGYGWNVDENSYEWSRNAKNSLKNMQKWK